MIIVKNEENLPIINKTKHTTKGEKKDPSLLGK
jgi:hypothetical protein